MKISAIKQQANRTGLFAVFVDGEFVVSLSQNGLLESKLAPNQQINAAQLAQLKKLAGIDKIYSVTLRYVALRPRSEWELQMYLKRKGSDEEHARTVLAKLRKAGLVDDLSFAKSWVADRRLLKSVSKLRLVQELKQKRIAEDIIDQVLQEDKVDEQSALRELIASKQRQSRYQDKTKLMRYLSGQGFGYGDIKDALNEQDKQ